MDGGSKRLPFTVPPLIFSALRVCFLTDCSRQLFHFIRIYKFLYEIHTSKESHVCGLQLIRRLQGQDGDVAGEEVPATPKRIFQILNQVTFDK